MLKSYLLNSPFTLRLALVKIGLLTILISLLAGCPANVSKQINYDETQSSQYYLSQFSSASGNDKTAWQLLAIRSLITDGNLSQAKQLIAQLPSDLTSMQQKESLLLQGELAAKSGESFNFAAITFNELTNEQKMRYYQAKLILDGKKNDINAKLRDYIELEHYGSTEQRHNTINDTWDFLRTLDKPAIDSVIVYANDSVLQGWIDLIYTYNNNVDVYPVVEGDDPDTVTKKQADQLNLLKNAINEWQLQYANHPAALYLPRTIYGDQYRLADTTNNKLVALFLPLSGSSKVFGDTIRQGYADAGHIYAQQPQQNITVYDTNGNSLDSLVNQAQQQGAQLIVGPLLKQDVVTIMKLSPSVPVLALNQVDGIDFATNQTNQICFFSLSPEDEAKDAANYINGQRKQVPLLIVPQSDLGQRVVKSFAQQWYALDPTINRVYVQYFDSEQSLSKQMNAGVGIELVGTLVNNMPVDQFSSQPLSHSATNFVDGSQVVGSIASPQFDAIYIYASHSELALIKSMLEMKSSQKQRDENGHVRVDNKGNSIAINKTIPAIYTSSRSNSADTTQDFRYDMDRVQFSDIPLIIDQNELISQLPNYIKDDYSLVRLYAMGVDAWQLANHFNQLKPNQTNILDGMTGKLSVGPHCEISRTQVWHQYLNGNDVAVP